jgi:DMSO/TMAO reductase YedYZ molybdopterin-dependent catalytic subunit
VVQSGASIPVNPLSENVDSNLPEIFRDPRLGDLVGSEVTDNRVFYRVDINAIPPKLDFDKWSLKVSGKVNNPAVLAKSDLLALPAKDEYATLECVSNTINPPGALISDTKWTGVSLPALLNQAGPTSEAKYVIFRCADGYTVGIPLERAMNPGALLAYRMGDEDLPTEHGFPLRAIVPGIYGMMNAKWITEIELTDQVYMGYWQERGWSNDARIKTTSIIYYPPSAAQVSGMTPIAGVAFAGDRGISKVEVSVDGGTSWNEATLKKPRSPYSWVLWAYAWTPTSKGNTRIIVRAYDGPGTVQDANATDPFPNGATGYHSIQVTIV